MTPTFRGFVLVLYVLTIYVDLSLSSALSQSKSLT
jgi:hypothetical protein